jgi:hypothetical protein
VQHVQVVQPLVESGVGPAADSTLENKLLDGGGYVEISLSADSQLGDQVDAALEAHSLFSGQAQVPLANSSGSCLSCLTSCTRRWSLMPVTTVTCS